MYYIKTVEEWGVDQDNKLIVDQAYAENVNETTGKVTLSFSLTNNKNVGNLSIEKKLFGNSNPQAAFWFTVTLTPPSGSVLAATYPAVKTLGETVENTHVSVGGNSFRVKLRADEKIEIMGLPAGTGYSIVESSPSQAGYTPGLQVNATGTIPDGGTASATMHNEFHTEKKIFIEGTKLFTNGTIQQNQFSFTISSDDNNAPMPQDTTVYAGTDGKFRFDNITFTLAQLQNGSGYATRKTYTYKVKENLPEGVEPTEADTAVGYKIVNGIRYDLRERTVTVTYNNSTGELTVTANPTTLNGPSDQFVNESVDTVSVTKEWKKKDGTTQAPPPDGTEITLNLYKHSEGEDTLVSGSSIKLNGVPEVADNPSAGQEVYPTGNTATNCESDAWVATWTNLPKYESGTEITYVVKEAEPTYGYTVSYNNGVNQYTSNNGIITNTLNETNIKIVKVDADHTETKLSGASFRLEKGTTTTDDQETATTTTTWAAYPDSTQSVKTTTTENDGEITFTDLTDGHYRLVETQSPAGYNMISGTIEFTITNGVVDTPTGNTVSYTFSAASGATPATFEVPNTPGIVLPATGGSGTLPYYLTGLTLTLGAALWLIFRRKRRENT